MCNFNGLQIGKVFGRSSEGLRKLPGRTVPRAALRRVRYAHAVVTVFDMQKAVPLLHRLRGLPRLRDLQRTEQIERAACRRILAAL